jgi:SAM-dependent methyltransferase
MHHRLVACAECDLLYADPAWPADYLGRAYAEAPFLEAEEASHAARTYAGLLRPWLPGLADRRGALDVGAGNGAFVGQLLELGFEEVSGAEPSRAAVAAAPAHIRPHLRLGPFNGAAFPAASLRLVSVFQTLEHVPEPRTLLDQAWRLLKPGGLLLAVVHNRRALGARLLGRRWPIYDLAHLQLFSPASLERLVSGAGFRAVTLRPVINRYPLAYWLRLAPLPARLKDRALALVRGSALGRATVALPAGNLAAVGLKPEEGRA